MSRALIFYTLVALWVALEFWLGRRRRSGGGVVKFRQRDGEVFC